MSRTSSCEGIWTSYCISTTLVDRRQLLHGCFYLWTDDTDNDYLSHSMFAHGSRVTSERTLLSFTMFSRKTSRSNGFSCTNCYVFATVLSAFGTLQPSCAGITDGCCAHGLQWGTVISRVDIGNAQYRRCPSFCLWLVAKHDCKQIVVRRDTGSLCYCY